MCVCSIVVKVVCLRVNKRYFPGLRKNSEKKPKRGTAMLYPPFETRESYQRLGCSSLYPHACPGNPVVMKKQ